MAIWRDDSRDYTIQNKPSAQTYGSCKQAANQLMHKVK